MWLPLALRNLLRNQRRTLLTLAVIALGTMMSFVISGMITNALNTLQEAAVSQYGNIQIASTLLWEDDNQGEEALIDTETFAKFEEILANQAAVTGYSPELVFSGIASTDINAKVINVMAFEPGNDALDYNNLLVEGEALTDEMRDPVLIGGGLSRELDLQPGDTFRLTTSTISGAYNQETYRVAGIYFRNDVQDESQLVFVPLDTGIKTFNTKDAVSKLAITLESLGQTDATAQAIQADLDAAGLNFQVRTWEQLSVAYQQTRGFFDMMFGFLLVSITLLVFFIVFQVLSMSFFERTREIGTIRAIGTKKQQVFSMFVLESLLIGVFGGLAGLAVGWGIGLGLNNLDFSWTPPGALQPFPVEAVLAFDNAWVPFLVAILATFLSALYPSMHSARIKIVDALRTN